MKQSEKLIASVAVMTRRVPRTGRELADLVDISLQAALRHLELMADSGLIEFHSFDQRPQTRGPKPCRWRWKGQ